VSGLEEKKLELSFYDEVKQFLAWVKEIDPEKYSYAPAIVFA
jgi:hypothetical protein